MGVRLIRGSREVRGVGVGGIEYFFCMMLRLLTGKKQLIQLYSFFLTPRNTLRVFLLLYIYYNIYIIITFFLGKTPCLKKNCINCITVFIAQISLIINYLPIQLFLTNPIFHHGFVVFSPFEAQKIRCKWRIFGCKQTQSCCSNGVKIALFHKKCLDLSKDF